MLMKTTALLTAALLPASIAVASGLREVDVPTQEIPAPTEYVWDCPTCSETERYVLQELQKETKIYDRNALATILGNIRQESNFTPNICEGGARVRYDDCHRGGYGIIQWTSLGRYNNLGKFCTNYGCDPSSLTGQVRYMINESVFQRYLPMFEGGGQTVSYYMKPAYYWLGWGIKGNRELYAYDYVKKLEKVKKDDVSVTVEA